MPIVSEFIDPYFYRIKVIPIYLTNFLYKSFDT